MRLFRAKVEEHTGAAGPRSFPIPGDRANGFMGFEAEVLEEIGNRLFFGRREMLLHRIDEGLGSGGTLGMTAHAIPKRDQDFFAEPPPQDDGSVLLLLATTCVNDALYLPGQEPTLFRFILWLMVFEGTEIEPERQIPHREPIAVLKFLRFCDGPIIQMYTALFGF